MNSNAAPDRGGEEHSDAEILLATCRTGHLRVCWRAFVMSVVVYGFPHSPFCLAVEGALRAFKVDFESRFVPSWDRTELLRLTGGQFYEVPVLQHGKRVVGEPDGDSQEIARYVDAHWGGGQLFPTDFAGVQEIVIRFVEHEVEDVTFKLFDPHYVDSIEDVGHRGMLVRHKERKFGRGCVERWRAERAELLGLAAERLAPLEAMLGHGPFLFGARPVFADFLLGGILGNMTYGGFNEVPAELPRLRGFLGELAAWRY